MILVGDLGGTKTHFACYDPQKCVFEKKFMNKDFNSFLDLLQRFLGECPHKPEYLSLAIAGPIRDEICQMSNLDWKIDQKEIVDKTPIKNAIFLNDLEAFGYGLEALKEEDLFHISPNKTKKEGHKGLLAPGTGLGVAQVLWDGKYYKSIPSEAGHSDFAPKNQKEINLLNYLYKKEGRAFYDQILSARGIYYLYQFICEDQKSPLTDRLKQEIEANGPSHFIIDKALKENDPIAIEALTLFIDILGHKSGDLALHLLPEGGIFLGGEIIQGLIPLLKESHFFSNFVSKGKVKTFLSNISVSVVLKKSTLLEGAAFYARYKYKL